MSPDRTEGSHSGPLGSGTQGGGASSGGAAPGGGGSSPSQAGQAGAQGPTGGNGAAGTPVHSGSGFVPAGAPRALAGHRSEVFELGSTVSTMGGSLISTGGSFSGGARPRVCLGSGSGQSNSVRWMRVRSPPAGAILVEPPPGGSSSGGAVHVLMRARARAPSYAQAWPTGAASRRARWPAVQGPW
jgi:hypothetical protein